MERFAKKNSKKTNQKKFIVEKVINRNGDILHVQGKATIFLLTIGLIRKKKKLTKKKQEALIHQHMLKGLI